MIIDNIQFTKPSEIISFYPFPKGSVSIETSAWHNLPMHPASGDMTVSTNDTEAGTVFRTNISCRLKNSISIPDACILKVTLCDGETLIIGTPDIPVVINKTATLYLNSITTIHNSFTAPLQLREA